jgi:hypothetical protein
MRECAQSQEGHHHTSSGGDMPSLIWDGAGGGESYGHLAPGDRDIDALSLA